MKASEYPKEYREIFAKALDDGVTLTFSTVAKARTFRVELYKYRYAVRDELPQSNAHYKELMKVALSVANTDLVLAQKKVKFVEKLNDK